MYKRLRGLKILNNIIFKLRYPNIKISIFANISPKFLKNIDKNLTNVLLGNSFISRNVRISEGTKFIGSVRCLGNVEIGRYTSLNGPNTEVLSEINEIKIGSFCSIASGVRIQEYYHEYRRATSYYINRNILNKDRNKDTFSKGAILIEDDVWIGANAIILSGVRIGRGSIIGAGSIVTKTIEPYSIVAGNPAKIIRKRFSEENIKKLENSKWWSWDIKKIKENSEFFTKIIN